MSEFTLKASPPRHYLYVEKTCSMMPEDVSRTMGDAFGEVAAFAEAQGITAMEESLSVYYTYDPDKMSFRAGFIVSPEDAAKAGGRIKTDTTPGEAALTYTHVGPYSELRTTYDRMTEHMFEMGKTFGAPTWEIYLNDPEAVPEEKLKTEIHMMVA